MVVENPGSVGYADQLQNFIQMDENRHALLTDMITEIERLQLANGVLRTDLASETRSRRDWQKQAEQLEIESESNQFILVVLDGDGAVFDSEYYRRGREGGADAAFQVRKAIQEQVRNLYPSTDLSGWNISVQLYLNAEGLASKLLACKVISSIKQFTEFSHGWVSQQNFFWTDVGQGKEKADHKIDEALRIHLHASAFKNVFLGPCLDKGYIDLIQKFRPDPVVQKKLILVEIRPSEPGFDTLGFTMVNIATPFRMTNLPERPSLTSQANRSSPDTVSATSSSPPRMTAPIPVDAPSSSWSTITRSSAPNAWSLAPANGSENQIFIFLNRDNQRVDSGMANPDTAARQRLFNHSQNRKLCNNYHIRGHCSAESNCPYLHGERLSGTNLLVLKSIARDNICRSGSACRDFGCIYGHHCKSDGHQAQGCSVPHLHDILKIPERKLDESGRIYQM